MDIKTGVFRASSTLLVSLQLFSWGFHLLGAIIVVLFAVSVTQSRWNGTHSHFFYVALEQSSRGVRSYSHI
jgi:hypothetical protein